MRRTKIVSGVKTVPLSAKLGPRGRGLSRSGGKGAKSVRLGKKVVGGVPT